MRLFDRKLSLLLLLICIPLLFLPKINLLRFEGETAGIRIDDGILFLAAGVLFWAHFALNKRMTDIERWISILTVFALFSFAANRIFYEGDLIHIKAKIFYSVRLFEYFLFFYIGAHASRFFTVSQVLKAFLGWNVLLMILQKLHLVGGVINSGYSDDVVGRVQGIASFPSEMGVLLNLLFCFMIYSPKPWGQSILIIPQPFRYFIEKTYLYWMFAIFSVLIIFTGNRISIAALLLCFFFKWKQDIKERLSPAAIIGAAVFSVLIFVIMGIAIINTHSVFQRSAELFSLKNVTLMEKVWDRINLDYDPVGRESVALEGYDASWWMRIHKWCYALKIYFTHPECWLQGVGPGFAMAALDGGWLRILTEYGIIGCMIFWKFFSLIYKKNEQLKWMLIAILINMVFFDVYMAYKPMSLLFFVIGYYYAVQPQEEESTSKGLDLAFNSSF